MAKVRFDMVAESSTTTGTGTITLGGAKNPGRTFATAGVATSDTFKYRISHDTNNEWEVGTGTLASSTTFTRSVIASSNANALVNFSAGNKTVELVTDRLDLAQLLILEGLTGVLRADAGVLSADSDVTDIVAAASDTAQGKIEIADQTEMEAATDVVRAVTPGRAHFHPGVAKCWLLTTNSTTILASYNMTSVTDTGTGDLTFTIANDFSSVNWVPVCTQLQPIPSTTVWSITFNCAKAAGTVDLDSFDMEKTAGAAAARIDATQVGFVGFGDI